MENILNYLKNLWIILKDEYKDNPSYFSFYLFLVTIPFSLGINNFFLALFFIFTLSNFSKQIDRKSLLSLSIPIILFLWLAASFFWSIDTNKTIKAIPKEISLLLLPITFLFLKKSNSLKLKSIKIYSYSWFLIVLYYLFRAIYRFYLLNDLNVFFYHGEYEDDYGLVPKSLNAIHVSVFVSLAYFYLISKEIKHKIDTYLIICYFTFIILLSSKNITIIFVVLNIVYFIYYSKIANKMRLRNIIIVLSVLVVFLTYGKIKDRFILEFQSNTKNSITSNVINGLPEGVHYVSIYEAWNNDSFTPNDFFPGTSFRVYQSRLFAEFLKEDKIFWKGFGLNASYLKLEEKGKKYNVFLGNEDVEGYQKKNFHNQYLQVFAELGLVGFIILILMLVMSLRKAIQNKDFLHISFTILMISLFLTESFLWRQRGVVFFTAFYCLFMMQPKLNKN